MSIRYGRLSTKAIVFARPQGPEAVSEAGSDPAQGRKPTPPRGACARGGLAGAAWDSSTSSVPPTPRARNWPGSPRESVTPAAARLPSMSAPANPRSPSTSRRPWSHPATPGAQLPCLAQTTAGPPWPRWARLRRLYSRPGRCRRHRRHRRRRRYLDRHGRDARAPLRHPEADGLDPRLRRRGALRRRLRYRHDAGGRRHRRAQPDHPLGARSRGARDRRNDPRGHRHRRPASARPDHVRRHHALRDPTSRAPRPTTTTALSSTPPAPAGARWRRWPTAASSPA